MTRPHIKHLASGGVITNYHCDLCTDIRGFLLQHNTWRFRELAPDGFYRG